MASSVFHPCSIRGYTAPLLLTAWITFATAAGLPHAEPAAVGMDSVKLAQIDALVADGIQQKKMPGCVVCIGRRGKIMWLKSYGNKQLKPTEVPMTTDTVFDLASITKPMATATSIMLLVERGQLKLDDKVVGIFPEFAANEKDGITIRDLLIHQSGLLPDNKLSDYDDGPESALQRFVT
jgi:CubicO group peptidase (beta-lactamase class C family)